MGNDGVEDLSGKSHTVATSQNGGRKYERNSAGRHVTFTRQNATYDRLELSYLVG